jgi:hypothetical protein
MTKLAFNPAKHGWHFSNRFVNVVLPGTPFRFETRGLCGGMVMSALDYWRSGTAIPTHVAEDFGAEDVPADASRLRTYIHERQMDSLLTGLMFTRWVVMPWFGPDDFHRWAVDSEFAVVRRQIDRGRPAMLGLWSMDGGQPTKGHQVLCYGYETSSPPQLWIYDPNVPDTEMVLVPVSAVDGCQVRNSASGAVRKTYRGYFWTDVYDWSAAPRVPPYVDVSLSAGLDVAPSGDDVAVGSTVRASVTIRNAGEYPARFQHPYVWVRGPQGENLDHLLGGAEPGISELLPGQRHLITRTSSAFGTVPGLHVIGVSYLSRQRHWLDINRGAPGTSGSRQVMLRQPRSEIEHRTVEVRESDHDVDTGVELHPGDEFALTATGSIWAGVWFTGTNGPEGWTDRVVTDPRFPHTTGVDAHPFALLARTGPDPYRYVGRGWPRRPFSGSATQRLWLRINDDVAGNGSGSFRCLLQVWR